MSVIDGGLILSFEFPLDYNEAIFLPFSAV